VVHELTCFLYPTRVSFWRNLRRPGNRFLGPDAVRVFCLEGLGDVAEDGVVVGRFVVAHALPIDGFGSGVTVRVLLQDFRVELFRVGPFLLHKADACQTEEELRGEFVLGQVAFDAMTLFAVFVEDEGGGRPEGIEAVEAGGVFLDVDGERDEFLVDEGRELRVAVGLGLQPSACASSRSGAEVDQQGQVLGLGVGERGINVFVPGNGHGTSGNKL